MALSYGRIAKIAAQFSHGLVNSAMGQIPCSTERISCFKLKRLLNSTTKHLSPTFVQFCYGEVEIFITVGYMGLKFLWKYDRKVSEKIENRSTLAQVITKNQISCFKDTVYTEGASTSPGTL